MTECVTDFLAVSKVKLNVTQTNVCGTRRSENETIDACLGHRTSSTFVGFYLVTLKWRLVTRLLVLGPHVLTDAHGIPLAMTPTGANRHDVAQLLPLVDAVPAVRGKRGRPRRRPRRLQGDRAYDSGPHRRELRRRGIEPVLARRRTEHGSGLGVFRWFVERTLSWVHQFGRLRLRWDRLQPIHKAFVSLACSLICLRFLD
jgi:transposase